MLFVLHLRRIKNCHHLADYHHRFHHLRSPVQIPNLPFSSLSSSQTTSPPSDSVPKPNSLSARMSFVFDQIDAIEKDRSAKDETLQRIRAWREFKKQPSAASGSKPIESADLVAPPPPPESPGSVGCLESKKDENEATLGLLASKKGVELVHPWPEWIALMERLVQQNYFNHKRKDEDKMIEDLGFNLSEMVEQDGFDFTRDCKTVQTAVLNFGRDRFDIFRSLSRQDLQMLVGYGCPSSDKKVVFSGKLLRKHVHLDEGDVCSSCSLRASCERAYLLTNKEDEARTMDVMRILFTYGFDTINGSVANKSLLKMKSLKTVVRKLLHEVVRLSAVPIDPNLPPPVIKKPPPKVKQPPPPPRKRVGRDDIEMKKGDWLCPKCDFMNFAKNTVCLQCDAKRPQRQLLPGEWECPQCNFLNYRRNMVCFHCEHKRPPDTFMESKVPERPRGHGKLENVSSRAQLPNAWNFDFDDNESDGADVAAFEYADSQKMDEDFPLGKAREQEDGYYKGSKHTGGLHERDYSDAGTTKPGIGFNDFDEDDDLDSYVLEAQNQRPKASRVDFSELDVSESEEERTGNCLDRQQSNFSAPNRPSQSIRKMRILSGSDDEVDFGSYDDLPVHPKWKSSHVTQFNRRSKGDAISFGTNVELDSDMDDISEDDFGFRRKTGNKWSPSRSSRREHPDLDSISEDDHISRQKRGNKWSPNRSSRRGGHSDTDDVSEDNLVFRQKRGNKRNSNRSIRRGQHSDIDDESFSDVESGSDSHFRRRGHRAKGNSHSSRGMDKNRNSSRDGFHNSSRGSHGKGFEDDYVGHRKSTRDSYSQNSRNPRKGGSYRQPNDRFTSNSYTSRKDSYLDDERYSRPRINVR